MDRQLTLTFIILTFLMSLTFITTANLSENFADPSLQDWELFGKDHQINTNGVIPDYDHTWEVTNEVLSSGGDKDSQITLNYACHKVDQKLIKSGSWTFDIYGSDDFFHWGFRMTNFPTLYQNGDHNISNEYLQYSINNDWKISSFDYKLNVSYIIPVESESLSKDKIEGWHTYTINRDRLNVSIFRDDVGVMSVNLGPEADISFDTVCLWTEVGSEVGFDNININSLYPVSTGPNFSNNLIWYIIFSSIFIIGAGVSVKLYFTKIHMGDIIKQNEINQEVIRSSKSEFNLSDMTLLSLLGQHNISQQYEGQEFKEMIPQELVTFRYLMHPIRLTIMKLLDGQQKMRSVEIKHILDLSWGEYGNHIKSLEEKGYVELVDEFNEDGHISQTVYILEPGRQEFQHLFELLERFVSHHSPYGKIINDDEFSFRDDQLYPSK